MFDTDGCAHEIAQLNRNDREVLTACILLALTHGADDRVNVLLRFVAESIDSLGKDQILRADLLDFFTPNDKRTDGKYIRLRQAG